MVTSWLRAGCWPCEAHTATSSARTATEQRRMGRTPDRDRGDVRYCFRPRKRCNGNRGGFVTSGRAAVGKTCPAGAAGQVLRRSFALAVADQVSPQIDEDAVAIRLPAVARILLRPWRHLYGDADPLPRRRGLVEQVQIHDRQ